MAKKHFCKHCKKEIEEGKGVKIQRGRKWDSSYYRSSRYSSYSSRWPREVASYYLCWDCYDKEEQELAKSKGNEWKWVLGIGGGIVFILLLFLFFFFWWLRREDRRNEKRWRKLKTI